MSKKRLKETELPKVPQEELDAISQVIGGEPASSLGKASLWDLTKELARKLGIGKEKDLLGVDLEAESLPDIGERNEEIKCPNCDYDFTKTENAMQICPFCGFEFTHPQLS